MNTFLPQPVDQYDWPYEGWSISNEKVRDANDYSAMLSKKAVSAYLAQNEIVAPGDCVHHCLSVCKARKP